jgi:O-antigen ligase
MTTIIGIEFHSLIPIFTPALNRVLGIAMGFLMLLFWSKKNLFMKIQTKELMLWVLFLAWALVTGIFVSVNQSAMFDMFFYLVQLSVLILGIITLVVLYGSINHFLYLNVVLFLILYLYLFVTGQTDAIYYMGGKDTLKLGNILNANTIGFMILGAVMSLLTLLKVGKGKWPVKLLMLALIAFSCYMILQTGSRKTALVLLMFLISWYLLCIAPGFGRLMSVKGLTVVFLAVAGAGLLWYVIIPYALESTYFGMRFEILMAGENESAITREFLYKEAWVFFKESPIFGIGLDQFRYHSITGLYAHSNYAEIFSDTGLIGGLLYFPIYFILGKKLWRIRKYSLRSNNNWYMSGCLLCMILAELALGFGTVSFTSISHWLIIAPIMGYVAINKNTETINTKHEL